ncbi:MAG TPA: NAD(P)-dependent oxidoreductase [bacterium]|nr:NAD(P)-dependent oxidoreductase [bacterium]HPN44629.1 NAD(P)-dependent oxidoreductase [bacterium]
MQKIGFIGLGIMGNSMCLNLLKAGFPVTAWNRTRVKMQSVIDAGAQAAASPQQVAENAEIIITMVSDSPDVQEVILGDAGVIKGVKSGSVVIDMSTISPAVTRDIAAELGKKGVAMLDAPVSGGDSGARNATLAIMVGGEAKVLERCMPVFMAMGKTVTHVGVNGMGQTVKLCNQILVSVTNMAVCEAILFARKSGVEPQVMIEAVKNGAAGSWQLSNLGPKMVAGDFNPGFMIDLQQKDLRLALETALVTCTPLPATDLVHQLFDDCQAHDEGRLGSQALFKALLRLAGE